MTSNIFWVDEKLSFLEIKLFPTISFLALLNTKKAIELVGYLKRR